MRAVAICLTVFAASSQRTAHAQFVDDPLGPIGCAELALDNDLSTDSAVDLCASATSIAPGQCYVAADDNINELTTQELVGLCRGATSNAPLGCYAELDARGDLTSNQIVSYCGTRCAIGPAPPEASSPACLAAALDLANLTTQMASDLCAGSRSGGPVQCFVTGEDSTTLSENQLVQLCAENRSCQYINSVSTTAY